MKAKNFLQLVLLAALWGPSFLFIKVGVAEIPPLTLVAGRVGVAGLVLYLILRGQGGRLPAWGPIWKRVALVALVATSLPFALFSWSELHIDSALASILNGTTPLFTIILAHFFTETDRLTSKKVAGVLLSLGGLTLLIAPALLAGVQATVWGIVATATAAACYAIAIVYSRNHLRGQPFLVVPTMQMLLSTLYVLPVALLVERPYLLAVPSLKAIGAVVALGVLGTAVAFAIYYRLVEHVDASYLSMVTYLVPIFGVILGVVVLDEQLTWNIYAGFVLILAGVMIVNGVFKRWPSRRLKSPAGLGESVNDCLDNNPVMAPSGIEIPG